MYHGHQFVALLSKISPRSSPRHIGSKLEGSRRRNLVLEIQVKICLEYIEEETSKL